MSTPHLVTILTNLALMVALIYLRPRGRLAIWVWQVESMVAICLSLTRYWIPLSTYGGIQYFIDISSIPFEAFALVNLWRRKGPAKTASDFCITLILAHLTLKYVEHGIWHWDETLGLQVWWNRWTVNAIIPLALTWLLYSERRANRLQGDKRLSNQKALQTLAESELTTEEIAAKINELRTPPTANAESDPGDPPTGGGH